MAGFNPEIHLERLKKTMKSCFT